MLRDVAQLTEPARFRHLTALDPVKQNPSFLWIRESGNQLQDSRLTGPTATDQRYLLIRLNRKPDILQGKTSFLVRKADFIQDDSWWTVHRKF